MEVLIMFDFFGFCRAMSGLAILMSGVTVLLTPIIMAITYDWKMLYLYVPIAIAFWGGSTAFKTDDSEDEDCIEEADDDESN